MLNMLSRRKFNVEYLVVQRYFQQPTVKRGLIFRRKRVGKYYIGVRANSKDESERYQSALFERGFSWANSGLEIQNHTNFYARIHDKKIITCYHDPSIDNESDYLTIDEILNIS